MRIKVASPGSQLRANEIDKIERDLEKIDRRLSDYDDVEASVRINDHGGHGDGFRVTLELDYGRNHLIAKADDGDMGKAVREAREEILRQIKDRSRGGHSSFVKGT